MRIQVCQGVLYVAPCGTPDVVRHPAWVRCGPVDDCMGHRKWGPVWQALEEATA
jgi:hypothetical protein